MSLHVLGDLHFSSLQEWRLPLGDVFLNWFSTYDPGSKDREELLCLGDCTDSAILPGKEIAQLKRFVEIAKSKFKKVYLMVGNHDYKLYKNKPQLSFEFVEQDGIIILREPAQVLDICGLHILSLPFYSHRLDLPAMGEYYSKLPDDYKQQHYDVIFGHFFDTSTTSFEQTIDISYLSSDYIALGHQHTRTSPHYIGSIFPSKVSENDSIEPRSVWVFEKKENHTIKKEVKMPCFGEYVTIDYPNPLPPSTANISIYTVTGCNCESLARSLYGNDIFIRGIEMKNIKKNKEETASDKNFVMEDPVKIFNEWIKDTKNPISRSTAALVRKMLTPPRATIPTN